IEHFEFEANRVLYAAGEVRLASKRLRAFALHNPASKLAIPSATLAFDTTIAGGKWDQVIELAETFVGVKEWKGSPFAKRVYVIASDAQYKKTETLASQKKPEEAIEQADVLL